MPRSRNEMRVHANHTAQLSTRRKVSILRLTLNRCYHQACEMLRKTAIANLFTSSILQEYASLKIQAQQLASNHPVHKKLSALCPPGSVEIDALLQPMQTLNRFTPNLKEDLAFFKQYLIPTANAIPRGLRNLENSLLTELLPYANNIATFANIAEIYFNRINTNVKNLRLILQSLRTEITNEISKNQLQNLHARLITLTQSFAKPTASVSEVQPGTAFTPAAHNAVGCLPPYVEEDTLSSNTLRLHMRKQQNIANRWGIR